MAAGRAARRNVVALVADDASGDQLGAHLIQTLRNRYPALEFMGIGGPKIEAAGTQIVAPVEALSPQGPFAAWKLARVRKAVRNEILRAQPALFVGIDAPEFNLDLAMDLKSAGVPTVQYATPAILNWPRERILQARKAVSLMLSVLPLESRVYDEARVRVAYVGHPLADALADVPPPQAMRGDLRLPEDAFVVTLMPGGRESDVARMGELFIRAAELLAARIPEARFLAPFESRSTKVRFEAALSHVAPEGLNLSVMIGHSLEAMAAADVVLVASGPGTLEAALLRRPMVIAHRANGARGRDRAGAVSSFTGTPNLVAGKAVAPELVDDEATPQKLADAVYALLADDAARAELQDELEKIRRALRQNCAEKALAAIRPLLSAAR